MRASTILNWVITLVRESSPCRSKKTADEKKRAARHYNGKKGVILTRRTERSIGNTLTDLFRVGSVYFMRRRANKTSAILTWLMQLPIERRS